MVSRLSGKPTVAHAANVMANDPEWQQQRIDVQDLNAILEGMFGWSRIRQIYLVFYRRPRTALTRFYDHTQYHPVLTPTKMTTRVVWVPSLADNPYRIPVCFVIFDFQQMLIRLGAVIVLNTHRFIGPGQVALRATPNQ